MHFDPFKGLRGATWLPEMSIIFIKLSNYLKDLWLLLDVMQVKSNNKRSLACTGAPLLSRKLLSSPVTHFQSSFRYLKPV